MTFPTTGDKLRDLSNVTIGLSINCLPFHLGAQRSAGFHTLTRNCQMPRHLTEENPDLQLLAIAKGESDESSRADSAPSTKRTSTSHALYYKKSGQAPSAVFLTLSLHPVRRHLIHPAVSQVLIV